MKRTTKATIASAFAAAALLAACEVDNGELHDDPIVEDDGVMDDDGVEDDM